MKIFRIITTVYILCFAAYNFYTAFSVYNGKRISMAEDNLTIAGAIICIVLAIINASLFRKNNKNKK